MSPITSGRNVERTCALIISTAFSPAAMSTPAAAYDSDSSSRGSLTSTSGVDGAGDAQRHVDFERVLRVELRHLHRVLAGEARSAERLGRLAGRGNEAIEVEVLQGVDAEVVGDLPDRHV